jgi:NAD(P)-dependent dehydrogenase (short-subunit alcohol dehydrogenase family)
VSQYRLDRAVEELTQAGISCDGVVCDVTDRSAVDRLAESASSSGEVVSVIHTAGLSPSMASPERIIEVNALGTVNVGEAFESLATPRFCLVNVASTAGHLSPGFPAPRRSYELARTDPARFVAKMAKRCNLVPKRLRTGIAYSLSKNFVIWYSSERAEAFGKRGARILSVSPGSFDTEMGRLEADLGAAALAEHSALGRYGTVEEIAEVLAFCASDKPGYLTGTDVLVDGGRGTPMTGREKLRMLRNL